MTGWATRPTFTSRNDRLSHPSRPLRDDRLSHPSPLSRDDLSHLLRLPTGVTGLNRR